MASYNQAPYGNYADWSAYTKSLGLNPKHKNETIGAFRQYIPQLYKGAGDNFNFMESLNPQRYSAIQRLIDSMSQSSQQAQMRTQQAGVMESGANAARQASLMNRSMGLGDGFNAGNTAGIMGQAARQQNDIARQYASPEHQQSVLQALMAAFGQAQQNPELQYLMQLFNPLQANEQLNASKGGGGMLGALGSVAGLATGMPWGSILGGKTPVGGAVLGGTQADIDRFGPFWH